jgi:hypothetical protein
VDGSSFGTAHLTLNGKTIASFTCSYPNPCPGDNNVPISPTKLAKPGAILSWSTSDCIDASGNPCTGSEQVMMTIQVGFELATPAAP